MEETTVGMATGGTEHNIQRTVERGWGLSPENPAVICGSFCRNLAVSILLACDTNCLKPVTDAERAFPFRLTFPRAPA